MRRKMTDEEACNLFFVCVLSTMAVAVAVYFVGLPVIDKVTVPYSAEYKLGYKEYPDNSTYDTLSHKDVPYSFLSGDSRYCVGWEAAREDAYKKNMTNVSSAMESRSNKSG